MGKPSQATIEKKRAEQAWMREYFALRRRLFPDECREAVPAAVRKGADLQAMLDEIRQHGEILNQEAGL